MAPWRDRPPARPARAPEPVTIPPGERLASHADPTAEAAIRVAPPSVGASFQCLTCHATGTSLDVSSWPVLAGRRVHVVCRTVHDDLLAAMGIDAWCQARSLCGPARQLGGG
jgi:hypothetical protein